MITLSATIKLLSGDSAQLTPFTNNITKNNNSPEIRAVIGVEIEPSNLNPFLLGTTKLGKKGKLQSKPQIFVSRDSCNENGTFDNELYLDVIYGITLTENDTKSKNISITFDTYNDQYPTEIEIDGVVYGNDTPLFRRGDLSEDRLKRIKFLKMNKPNIPLVIEEISLGLTINVDRRNLLSYNRNIRSKADIKTPSWGIVSNGGNLSFADTTKEVLNYCSNNILKNDQRVLVYLENNIIKEKHQIADIKTSDWQYDNDSFSVSVTLDDRLTEWQDIVIDGISYDQRKAKPQTGEYFYKWLYEKTPTRYFMLDFNSLDEKTKNILTSTTIYYPTMESGTLWQGWNKLCQACGLLIYNDFDGKTKCVSD